MFEASQWRSIRRWIEQAAPAPHEEMLQPYGDIVEDDASPLDPYLKWVGLFHRQFPELCAAFGQSACAADLALPAPDLMLALALAAFGPDEATPPPAQVWHDLTRLAATMRRADVVDDAQYRRDLVIAYGCGWSRSVTPVTGGWEAQWQNSMLALCSMVMLSVEKALKQLSERVETDDLTSHRFDLSKGEIVSYANYLMMQLTSVPPLSSADVEAALRELCAPAAEQSGDQQDLLDYYLHQYVTLCGDNEMEPAADIVAGVRVLEQTMPRYHHRHRIVRWNPHECRLWHFVADAVYGPSFRHQERQHDAAHEGMPRQLQGGAFASSMLYPLLAEDRGVVVGQVEFKRCHDCGAEYHRDVCECCKIPADRSQTYYFARKNWIIIPRERGGRYELVQRWPCSQCDNLYPFTATPGDLRQEKKVLLRQERALNHLITTLKNANKRTSLLTTLIHQSDVTPHVLAEMQTHLHDPQPLIALAQHYLGRCQQELAQRTHDLAEPPYCPLDGGKPRQRPVTVWIYHPGGRVDETLLMARPDATGPGTLAQILALLLAAQQPPAPEAANTG